MRFVRFFNELSKDDVQSAGGKNANLGEMINAGIPVPPGFAVLSDAYAEFIDRAGIKEKIRTILSHLDVNDYSALEKVSERIRSVMVSSDMPQDISMEIADAYEELSKLSGKPSVRVAVRSSATAEDLPEASFAGQQATFLNVSGIEALLDGIKKCWASLFTARAIFYRQTRGFDHFKILISVGVQRMVDSRVSGIMFTIDPVTGDDNVVIESSWGLGEYVVGGRVTPDRFVVDKKTMRIVFRDIREKKIGLFFDEEKGENVEVAIDERKVREPSLKDDEVLKLANIGLIVENHYGMPMDIEFAVEDGDIYVVQARPITAVGGKKMVFSASDASRRKVLVKGIPASPGIGRGRVRVLSDPLKEGSLFQAGEVLVARMTDPDWVPLMKKACAVVTDEGGMTAHAAIVSRELGIPCIVGTGDATSILRTGMEVTVNATVGVVYEGIVDTGQESGESFKEVSYIPTATRIYMNLGQPDLIDRYAGLPFDGIGLMRIEFIISELVGEHPLHMVRSGKSDVFVEKLSDGISKVAEAVYPRPVVVRFSDFKTNEYRELKGGSEFEPVERNPMIGWRGVSRYVSGEYEPAFRLECRAIKRCRDNGLKNVWVMFPFVRTVWELKKALRIMESEGLERDRDFKVWVMAEVPSVVFLGDVFGRLVDGFSIGSNDLTQLVLGVGRDSKILADLGYFDERDDAVKTAISMLIDKAHSVGASVSICGQAPSVYPDFTRFLIESGIDSISVNPDAVVRTRHIVASEEMRIVLRKNM